MDDAGRYTAEHTWRDANLEVRKLKHWWEVAEDKIRKVEKQLAEKDNVSVINYGLDHNELNINYGVATGEDSDSTSMVLNFDEDLPKLDIGKSVKEEPELRSVISEKYNKFGEDAWHYPTNLL